MIKKYSRKGITFGLIALFLCCFTLSANAATVTWTGGGDNDLASNSDNWSGVAPRYGDDVVFDSTSKNCTWDLDIILASLSINSGYTGTVTLSSNLTIKPPTYVNGIISTDTTWTLAGSPYIVTGDIYVYGTTTEPTLTIEPGVVVKFDGPWTLYIGYFSYKGRLNAQGTLTAPIVFTSNKATPPPGDWGGLQFYNHATTESILDYVTVEYGGGSGYNVYNIYIDNSSPTIKNSTIRYSYSYGIYAGSSAFTVIDSIISNNGTYGIYAVSGTDSTITTTITGSTISNNGAYGVFAGGLGSINISFSTIKDNPNYAVYSESSILKVNHCNITGNGGGILGNPGNITDVRFNWWGSATGPSGVGPGTGQSVSSGINFEPWLGSPFTYPFHNTDFHATIQEFSPLNNLVSYTFSISDNSIWTFLIKNSGGTTVKTFSGSGASGAVTWDGKDEGGVIVPDGIYTYQLSSTRLSDNSQSAPLIGDVKVDSALPKAEITYPVNGQFIIGNSPLNIQGTATDTDFYYYRVEYAFGTAPTTWTYIADAQTPVNAGTLATWDTSNLTETYYTIRLSVADNAGNTATASVEVKFLNIYSISASDPYFSPNGDNSKDATTVTASITYPSNWAVDIKNSDGTVVKTFTGTGTSISVTWDGKDSSGVVQPEGVYSYTITATEPNSGTVATKISNITIDLTPPLAHITSPVASQEVYENVTIIGTAADAIAKDYHYLYYGAGTNPESYTLFASDTVDITAGILGTWNTHTLTNGIYTLKLFVMDKAGNSIETTVPVTVNNASVSDLTASVNFNPSLNQSSAINYTLARGGLITIRIGTYSSYFRTLISNAKRPAGENTDYWDGRNDLGELVPPGNYLIAIYTTTDIDPMPATAPRINDPLATPARFDPTTDVGATISYSLSKSASVTVGIYDFSDNLIRNVVINVSQLQGSNSVIWDGKNNSGNYSYPGAYRYKITATDSDSVTGPEITGIVQVYY